MNPLMIDNPADFGRVAVLMGGQSAERDISINSGTAVFNALKSQGVDVEAVDVTDNLIDRVTEKEIDRVFNMIHGRGGEDGVLQAILDVLSIPYTGSGVLASALSMDKLRTKLCWRGMGLNTPDWTILKDEKDIDVCIDQLGFPVIVKPVSEGSSLGMSKAENRQELILAYSVADQFQCDVYAEQWVEGDEYTVAILDGKALPVIRLQTPNAFYDYQAKYQSETTRYFCPSGLSKTEERTMQKLAESACAGLSVSGWGRVDTFIDTRGQIQLIEVNTVPGMTDHSLVPMAAKAAGCDFDELVWRILETSF